VVSAANGGWWATGNDIRHKPYSFVYQSNLGGVNCTNYAVSRGGGAQAPTTCYPITIEVGGSTPCPECPDCPPTVECPDPVPCPDPEPCPDPPTEPVPCVYTPSTWSAWGPCVNGTETRTRTYTTTPVGCVAGTPPAVVDTRSCTVEPPPPAAGTWECRWVNTGGRCGFWGLQRRQRYECECVGGPCADPRPTQPDRCSW
jgi:hypothetical protein